MTNEKELIDDIIAELTTEIRSEQDYILSKICRILDKTSFTFQQFNGRFGGKNNTYVDSVRTQFIDFDDFYAQWLKGLMDLYEYDKAYQLNIYNRTYENKASFLNFKLIQDQEIERFVKKFLERNFYNKLYERIRIKPDEIFWSLWFGYQLTYGIIIAPVKRGGEWTNDKSEMRKASYAYWTIGHILTEGLIDPNLNEPIKFKSINEFLIFYQSVLKRLSVSPYEQAFCERYIDFLKRSSNVDSEPFLIPELRYDGLIKKHDHRLDFTVLNPYTYECTGFEISPASTHMKVTNLKEKQFLVNDDLKKQWEKEMQKRNDYFKTFGISTITFTDSDLCNIDNCFKTVEDKLNSRPKENITLRSQLARLRNLQ